jgi:hypothetical protein
MIPKADLSSLEDQLKRTTFDAKMEETIKRIPGKNNKPFIIDLELFIESISGFSEVDNQFQISVFLVLNWRVSKRNCVNYYRAMAHRGVKIDRGANKNFLNKIMTGSDEQILNEKWHPFQATLEKEHFGIFWMPDIFIGNAKSTFSQVNALDTQFLEVEVLGSTSGKNITAEDDACDFRWIQRFGATIACKMFFRYYPIDIQICPMFFRSLGYDMKQLLIHVKNVSTDNGVRLRDQSYEIEYKDSSFAFMGLQRSVAKITIVFTRSITSLFVGQMIPATLTVTLVLSSMWLNLDALNDRFNVGMVCLFTLLTQFVSVRSEIPKVSYITFIDFYMILCIVFVVIQLLESIVVKIIWNREVDKRKKQKKKELKARANLKKNQGQTMNPNISRFYETIIKRPLYYNRDDDNDRDYFRRNHLDEKGQKRQNSLDHSCARKKLIDSSLSRQSLVSHDGYVTVLSQSSNVTVSSLTSSSLSDNLHQRRDNNKG